MENRDRVGLTVGTQNTGTWQLLVSYGKAKAFNDELCDGDLLNTWIEITGLVDHRDANEVTYVFRKENIECVRIIEVKV